MSASRNQRSRRCSSRSLARISASDATMTATVAAPRATQRAGTVAFVAMLARDLRVVRKDIVPFLIRTVMQPLLTTFVFAYVFPKIGQGIGGSPGSEDEFSTLLAPGLISFALIFQGIQAVAL